MSIEPFAAPERRRGVRKVLIAAATSAAVTGAVYLITRPESAPRPAAPSPVASGPVVPGDFGPPPVPRVEGTKRVGLLRQVLRQVRAQIAQLRARLRTEEDPSSREALRAQIRVLRQGIRQLEQQIAATGG